MLKKKVFVHYRDDRNRPSETSCLVKDEEGNVAIGFAICSCKDIPCKKTGRTLAYNRAVGALGKKGAIMNKDNNRVMGSVIKEETMDLLTEYELKLYTEVL